MRYIALLRGINVGGNTMIKMAELKETLVKLGFTNVTSYINSGNLAFDTRKAAETGLVKRIETAVEKRFGRAVTVMVREQKAISDILANNPYEGEYADHKEMHVLFLGRPISADEAKRLSDAALEGERYAGLGREIYCHLPHGVADSLLTKGFIEKKLGLVFTARNWRTVDKLKEL